jgi:hypothetical protein
MVLHSEQIDHQVNLIVCSCHLSQFSHTLTFKLVINTRYTYSNDTGHEIFQLTPVVSTQKHCVSLTATRER